MSASGAEDDVLLGLAKAVADGTDVDWKSAEESSEHAEFRGALAQLRIVSNLAEAYRAAGDTLALGPSVPPATLPKTWGRLEIRRELGHGRFGTVYLAWDPALECEVALKILHGAERSAEVVQEARLLARVRHPNVVTVHGVDQFDDAVGLRMEFIEGLSLKQALVTWGVLGNQEAALIGVDLCRAVAAVHKAGLLHRDIKTHNVMRETGGRTVLMDFGAGEVRTSELNESRLRAGTPLYLAPEIFQGQPATIASDLYSLGVLLFHLVTLDYPVQGNTLEEVIAAHAAKRRQALADLRPDLPAAFVQVVECALDEDPARRFRSAGAMQQALAVTLGLDSARPAEASLRFSSPRPETQSIAVLPFVSLGPDQDIEYLCDGLAEELMIGLGKLPGLRVASRAASKSLQTATDIRSICRDLDVTAVLEGTVRKSGDRLRVTVQLVSAADGCHIWSEGYNRDIADVLALQEDIAQNVVDKLQVTLAQSGADRLTRHHTDSPRAYHLYLKGRFYWARRYQAGMLKALEYFQKAIEEDAGYALAYAGVADAYTLIGLYSLMKPRDAFARASVAVHRALEIDPALPEAHTSLALVKVAGDWDFPAAEQELRRALALDPRQALPRIYLSWVLVLRGDPATALVEARRAQETEPLSPLVNAGVGFTMYLSRRYSDGVLECEKALEVDPNFLLATHFMAMCRAQQSRFDEAIALSERTVAMSDRAPFYLGLLGHYYARAGQAERAAAILAELIDASSRKYVPPHCMVYIHAGSNDLDQAFEWLKKAHDDGASPFNYFSPVVDNVQRDPRHPAELQRMGLKL